MHTIFRTAGLASAFTTRLLEVFPYVVVFLFALTPPIDPDLGWHLKYGEYIFTNHALLLENTFSTAMPGYRYLNHSWGSELLLYTIFRSSGFLGVTVLGASLMTLTFFFLARAAALDLWSKSLLFPILLFLLNGVIEQSFRAQYFSFLGISCLIYLLGELERQPWKTAVLIPLLFLLWANLHGQFIMGLGLFFIWLVLYGIRTRQTDYSRGAHALPSFLPYVTLLTAVAATLVNPYGIELYREIFRHFGNPMQKFIVEWQPIHLAPALFFIFLAWSSLLALEIGLARSWRNFTQTGHYLLPLLFLFLATLDQRRYFWPMALLSIPPAASLAGRIKPTSKGTIKVICLTLLGGLYLFAASEKLPTRHLFSFDWNKYSRYNSFSPRSAEVLQGILPGRRMFSDYNLGGWLIWNYPTIKPNIDGRMPFWRDDNGYSAYEEYHALEQGVADIDKSAYDLVYWPPHKSALYNRLITLTIAGKWRHVYDDPFASIFVRASDKIGQFGHEDGT